MICCFQYQVKRVWCPDTLQPASWVLTGYCFFHIKPAGTAQSLLGLNGCRAFLKKPVERKMKLPCHSFSASTPLYYRGKLEFKSSVTCVLSAANKNISDEMASNVINKQHFFYIFLTIATQLGGYNPKYN
ncbi:hypothetical protein ILYODFUR_038580 [Ilyodon furcidens]|uniref:Uncharacterized protein n=1 Tax=Ilyodon furcidens TaxID=33524 RepID=A0ABV0TEN4_9TELE